MKKTGTSQKLVECAILIAMSFALSFISIIKMPYGGDVTAASMLPVIIAAYRNGPGWGLLSGFTYSLLQLITGISNVSYATSATAAVAIIMLDYIVAFTVLGLVGMFKRFANQTLALTAGTLIVCILRFICHVITGCTVWAGVSIPSADGMIYSLVYNAAYMIPETIITVYVAALISNSVDLKRTKPVTKKKSTQAAAALNGVMIFGISVVADFVYLFSQVQNEKGFDITLIRNASMPLALGIVLVGLVLGTAVYFIRRKKTPASIGGE